MTTETKHTQFNPSVHHEVPQPAGTLCADWYRRTNPTAENILYALAHTKASHDDLLAALQQAVRYIEVSMAYKGAMTAAEVECQIIANRNISMTEIAANSCNTLASFEIEEARAAIAKATKE